MATARPSLRRFVFGVPIADELLDRLTGEFADVEFIVAPGDRFPKELAHAQAAADWQLPKSALRAAPDLAWFQSVAAGVESVLTPEMRERNILVTNTSGVHAPNISEHVLAMMLAFARRLPHYVRSQRAGEWDLGEAKWRVFELEGQTLVVVGLGAIGDALARKASALGMDVIGVRRDLRRDRQSSIHRVVDIDQMESVLPEADHVAICLPLTPATRGMFERAMLARMRPGSYLYNIGRGAVVHTDALVEALRSGHIAGAGLDVVDPEPPPADSPLWAMDNVLLTGHAAGTTPHYWDRVGEIVVDNIRRFRSGAPLRNLVSHEEGY